MSTVKSSHPRRTPPVTSPLGRGPSFVHSASSTTRPVATSTARTELRARLRMEPSVSPAYGGVPADLRTAVELADSETRTPACTTCTTCTTFPTLTCESSPDYTLAALHALLAFRLLATSLPKTFQTFSLETVDSTGRKGQETGWLANVTTVSSPQHKKGMCFFLANRGTHSCELPVANCSMPSPRTEVAAF